MNTSLLSTVCPFSCKRIITNIGHGQFFVEKISNGSSKCINIVFDCGSQNKSKLKS